MDGFDADVLIDAAKPETDGARRVARLLLSHAAAGESSRGVGSTLLWVELLSKPLQEDDHDQLAKRKTLLSRLELIEVDEETAVEAAELRARYGLATVDAVHLATAFLAGADRFITNNRRDFTKDIAEVRVTYPDEL